MIVIHFPLPAKPINMNDRSHWASKARRTKAWREAAWAGVMVGIPIKDRPQPRSVVQLVIPVKSLKVRRDPSNWAPTTKACVDGLVDSGMFEDDNSEYVVTVEPRFHTKPDVEIHITPWETA